MLFNDKSRITFKKQRLAFGFLIVMTEDAGVRVNDVQVNLRLTETWH